MLRLTSRVEDFPPLPPLPCAWSSAAPFAVVTAVTAGLFGPVALYWLVRQETWLRARLSESRFLSARALRCGCGATDDEDLHLASEASRKPPTLLAPVLFDFKPAAWYTKFMDIGLTLLLAALQATLPRPATLSLVVGKAVAICSGTLLITAHLLIVRPYILSRLWMGHVRSVLLVLAACCAAMNAVASAIDLGVLQRGPRLSAGFVVASVVMLLLVGAAMALLVRGVGTSMVSLAAAEQEEARTRRRQWSGAIDDDVTAETPRARALRSPATRRWGQPKAPPAAVVASVDMQENPLLSDNGAKRRDRLLRCAAGAPIRPPPAPGAAGLSPILPNPATVTTRLPAGFSTSSPFRARYFKAFGPGGALSSTPSAGRGVARSGGMQLQSGRRRVVSRVVRTSRSSSSAIPDVTDSHGIDDAANFPQWRLNPLGVLSTPLNAWRLNPLRVQLGDPFSAPLNPWRRNPLRVAPKFPTATSLNPWRCNPLQEALITGNEGEAAAAWGAQIRLNPRAVAPNYPFVAPLNPWTRNPLRKLPGYLDSTTLPPTPLPASLEISKPIVTPISSSIRPPTSESSPEFRVPAQASAVASFLRSAARLPASIARIGTSWRRDPAQRGPSATSLRHNERPSEGLSDYRVAGGLSREVLQHEPAQGPPRHILGIVQQQPARADALQRWPRPGPPRHPVGVVQQQTPAPKDASQPEPVPGPPRHAVVVRHSDLQEASQSALVQGPLHRPVSGLQRQSDPLPIHAFKSWRANPALRRGPAPQSNPLTAVTLPTRRPDSHLTHGFNSWRLNPVKHLTKSAAPPLLVSATAALPAAPPDRRSDPLPAEVFNAWRCNPIFNFSARSEQGSPLVVLGAPSPSARQSGASRIHTAQRSTSSTPTSSAFRRTSKGESITPSIHPMLQQQEGKGAILRTKPG